MSAMEIIATAIPGCLLLRPTVHRDERGIFVKTYAEECFRAAGLATDWREEFFSVSARGVLRGLHFQVPPHEQAKLVCCLAGRILDAVVDLRRGSPTYGQHALFPLEAGRPELVYLPPGMAHGFVALCDGALVSYRVSSGYAPEADRGIRWDSAGIPWPAGEKLVSSRDGAFPALAGFDSPFAWEGVR